MLTTPLYENEAGNALDPIHVDLDASASDLVDMVDRRVAQASAITELLGALPPTAQLSDNCMANASWILRDLLTEVGVFAHVLQLRTQRQPPTMKAVRTGGE